MMKPMIMVALQWCMTTAVDVLWAFLCGEEVILEEYHLVEVGAQRLPPEEIMMIWALVEEFLHPLLDEVAGEIVELGIFLFPHHHHQEEEI